MIEATNGQQTITNKSQRSTKDSIESGRFSILPRKQNVYANVTAHVIRFNATMTSIIESARKTTQAELVNKPRYTPSHKNTFFIFELHSGT